MDKSYEDKINYLIDLHDLPMAKIRELEQLALAEGETRAKAKMTKTIERAMDVKGEECYEMDVLVGARVALKLEDMETKARKQERAEILGEINIMINDCMNNGELLGQLKLEELKKRLESK